MKKVNYLASLLIIIVSLLLTVGYSAFSNILYVDGMSIVVRAIKDIRVTGISLYDISGGSSIYEEYDVNSIILGVNLNDNSSFSTYKISITNYGNVDMGILNISGINDNVIVEVSEYNLGDKICNSLGECNGGITKEFYITIRNNDSNNNNTFNIKLDFDFREFHSITYNNIIIEDDYPLPIEVLDGDNLSIDFTYYRIPDLTIRYGDFLINDYLYQNFILNIDNINGDIIVDCISYDGDILKNQVITNNLYDHISLIQTADGTLNEVHDILHRMFELTNYCINSANLEDTDLFAISSEMEQLILEIDRMGAETEFNGISILANDFIGEDAFFINFSSSTIILELREVNSTVLDIPYIEYTSSDVALAYYPRILNAIDAISEYRSYLGAKQNEFSFLASFFEDMNNILLEYNNIKDTEYMIIDLGLNYINTMLERSRTLAEQSIINYNDDVTSAFIEISFMIEAINVIVGDAGINSSNLLDGSFYPIPNLSSYYLGINDQELYLDFSSIDDINLSIENFDYALEKINNVKDIVLQLKT